MQLYIYRYLGKHNLKEVAVKQSKERMADPPYFPDVHHARRVHLNPLCLEDGQSHPLQGWVVAERRSDPQPSRGAHSLPGQEVYLQELKKKSFCLQLGKQAMAFGFVFGLIINSQLSNSHPRPNLGVDLTFAQ